jgi:nucleoside-diphosphate-sugar epimerase
MNADFDSYRKIAESGDLASPELSDAYRAEAIDEAMRVWLGVVAQRGLRRRRVLLIGGGGYIGVPLAQHLLRSGYDVLNVDWFLYGHNMASVSLLGQDGYELQRIDFTRTADVKPLFPAVSDVIILAGLVGDPITKKFSAESDIINDKGIGDLIDACHGQGLNKVIFVSTCSNYGEIPEGVLADEDYELKPLSFYARAKVKQEQYLKAKDFDFHWTVLRFATAFGLAPRMRFDLTVNQFTRELFLRIPLEVYDAETWRPYCHVRDFARALVRVLEAPVAKVDRNVFNTGGDANNFTKSMILDAIEQRLPHVQYKLVTGGRDRRNYKVDFSRIRNALSFEPHYSIPDGIDETIHALQLGYFGDHDAHRDYYGNYNVSYAKHC